MKLSERLNLLLGKELTAEHIAAISADVDVIKNRAVEKETSKLTSLQEKHKETEKQLSEYQVKEQNASLKEAFIKAGGNPEKFESFKKAHGQIEKLEDVKFEETFEEFPSLKNEEEPNPFSSNLSSITDPKAKAGEAAETAKTDEMGFGEESLIS